MYKKVHCIVFWMCFSILYFLTNLFSPYAGKDINSFYHNVMHDFEISFQCCVNLLLYIKFIN